jgi:hypothetical protein
MQVRTSVAYIRLSTRWHHRALPLLSGQRHVCRWLRRTGVLIEAAPACVRYEPGVEHMF